MSGRYSYETLKYCIDGWRDAKSENPPAFAEIVELEDEFGEGSIPTLAEYEEAMLVALKLGKVGMDGFKYCWPEVAKLNWQNIQRWKTARGL